jgi:REP element-mobilizing transposase RayT
VLDDGVDEEIKNICLEISQRYEIEFVEIGMDHDHAHFLIQSVPMYSPTKIIRIVKSITAREIFKRKPLVKKKLWGGEFWTEGYFVNTVGQHGNEEVLRKYVQNQGKDEEYKKLHRTAEQLSIF